MENGGGCFRMALSSASPRWVCFPTDGVALVRLRCVEGGEAAAPPRVRRAEWRRGWRGNAGTCRSPSGVAVPPFQPPGTVDWFLSAQAHCSGNRHRRPPTRSRVVASRRPDSLGRARPTDWAPLNLEVEAGGRGAVLAFDSAKREFISTSARGAPTRGLGARTPGKVTFFERQIVRQMVSAALGMVGRC